MKAQFSRSREASRPAVTNNKTQALQLRCRIAKLRWLNLDVEADELGRTLVSTRWDHHSTVPFPIPGTD